MASPRMSCGLKKSASSAATSILLARYQELPGQRHDVHAKALAPVLADFFCATPALSR